MDEYGQIGPEKGDYEHDCAMVAGELAKGLPVYVHLTHRMTQQQLVLCLKDRMSLTAAVPGTGGGQWLLIVRVEKGAYWFRVDHKQDPGYLARWLGGNEVDAETVADFIERIACALGTEPVATKSVIRAL